MIKRTIYLGNPYYVSVKDKQLLLQSIEAKGIDKTLMKQLPLEDLGILILDHQQITLTHSVLQQMAAYNIALVSCDANHMPASLLMPLEGHNTMQERFRNQIEASEPLKKQMWQQTMKAKIGNQAQLLAKIGFTEESKSLKQWAADVNSGDTYNLEGRAAVLYWKTIFSEFIPYFTRERMGMFPNNLLNYSYTIIRAAVARALVGSGMLPTLGIHHKNKYNAYCLADDIMEPYRIYADQLVYDILKESSGKLIELDKDTKAKILSLLAKEVIINEQRSPMLVALQRTTSSLAQGFEGTNRKIAYPIFE
ncbi:MAG: type II CRISPR-associated endonuclease Cas1 [Bacteroidia bacterium]|nr:type II CRISPR-associated endonuclease Cas1 [Bacteroidia bacterium]